MYNLGEDEPQDSKVQKAQFSWTWISGYSGSICLTAYLEYWIRHVCIGEALIIVL